MKTYIKSILALATAALLGSSAWAAVTSTSTDIYLCVGDKVKLGHYYGTSKNWLTTMNGTSWTSSSSAQSGTYCKATRSLGNTAGKTFDLTIEATAASGSSSDTIVVKDNNGSGTTYNQYTYIIHVSSERKIYALNTTETQVCNSPKSNRWSSPTSGDSSVASVTSSAGTSTAANTTTATITSKGYGSTTCTVKNYTTGTSRQSLGAEYTLKVTVEKLTYRGQEINYTGAVEISTYGTGSDPDLILKYTSGSGTLVIPTGYKATADILVVGGGGSGSSGGTGSNTRQGFGGKGGTVTYKQDQGLSAGTYSTSVGGGGASVTTGSTSSSRTSGKGGTKSSFSGGGLSTPIEGAGGTAGGSSAVSGSGTSNGITGSNQTYGKDGASSVSTSTKINGTAGEANTGNGGSGGAYRGTSGEGGSGVVIVRLTNLEELPAEGEDDINVPQGGSAEYTTSADLTSGSETGGSLLQSVTVSGKTATLTAKSAATIGGTTTVELRGASNKLIKILNVTITEKPKEITYRGRTIKYLGAATPTIVNKGTVNETITFSFETVGDGMLGLPADVIADYLVVGGGGGGGGSYYASQSRNRRYGKGGNGGNKIEKANKQKLVGGTYAVKVGKGGDGGAAGNGATAQGGNGDPSSFNGDSADGGAGGTYNQTSAATGNNGDGYTTASVLTGKNYGKGGAAAGNSAPTAVDANTGNGGGAGSASSNTTNNQKGGAGGSGVVVVKIYGFVETPAASGDIVGTPTLTYGQTLAAITTFTGTMKDSQGNAVSGTFAFNSKTTKPTVAQSGTTFTATFTPDSSMPWYQANSSVDVVVTVEKATPTVTAWPTASDIQQTQALSDSVLTGGSATPAGGTFAWAEPTTKPNMGDGQKFAAIYMPTDLENYTVATGEITINVKPPPKEPIEVKDAASSSQVNGKNIPDEDNYPLVKMNGAAYTFDVDTVNSMIDVEDASAFQVAANYNLTAAELSKFTLNGVSGADVAAALLGPNGTFSGGSFALSDSGITLVGGTFTYADDMTLAVPGGLVLATDVTFAVPANKTLVVSDEMTISGSGKMIVAGEGLVDFLGDKVDVDAQGWTGTVDGEEHAPTVTAPLTKFAPDRTPDRSTLVEYSTDGTTWSITAPTFDAVGQHSVSYRVTVGGVEKKTGSVNVVISKMQDQTISLSLLQSEVKTIEVVGAVPGEEWTAVSATPASVSVSPASGSGKSFHVTFTAGANKTTSPVTVTIKCDSVTYTYNVSVVGAYEENKVNLAYGGEGFADEVTMYYWYRDQNDNAKFQPRHYQATYGKSNYGANTAEEMAECNAFLGVDLKSTTAYACIGTKMAAKASEGSATIGVWRSSNEAFGALGGTPQQNGNYSVVLKPKRVVYVGKTVEAYCLSSCTTTKSPGTTSFSYAWSTRGIDTDVATVALNTAAASTSVKPTFTGVGVGRTSAIVENVQVFTDRTLSGSWPSDVTDGTEIADCTNGASYRLWVEVRDIPALQGALEVGSIVYGQTLADSVITPGVMKDKNGNVVKGTFEWADSTIAPKVSDSEKTSYNVIFTPENEFYDTVILSVTVKVYAPLTVTANDKEITRGHDRSEVTFDVQYDGFIDGDDEHDLGGKLAFDCTYDKQTALAGEKYAITPKGLTSDKYAITFVDGNLTVVAPVLAEKILTDVDRSSGVNAQNLNDEEFLPVVVLENAPYYFDTDATNVAVEVRNASAFVTQDPYELTYGQIARFTLNGLLGANFGAAFLSAGTTFTGSFSTKTGETDVVTFNGGTFTCLDDATVAFAGEIALAADLAFDVADGKVVTIGADNVLSGAGKIVKTATASSISRVTSSRFRQRAGRVPSTVTRIRRPSVWISRRLPRTTRSNVRQRSSIRRMMAIAG